MTHVTTYEAPSGGSFDLCPGCERALSLTGDWPRNGHGDEHSQVSEDLHEGRCGNCDREARRGVDDALRAARRRVGADEEED